MNKKELFDKLKNELLKIAEENKIIDAKINIKCKALSSEEAIGNPEKKDFPIIKGKEKLIEADFKGTKGQAFTDNYNVKNISIKQLLESPLDSNSERAEFIAALNAVYNHYYTIDDVIHCKNKGPKLCSKKLDELFDSEDKVLIIGFQPRFLEFLSDYCDLKAIDMDEDNIGKEKFGVMISSPDKTEEYIDWADKIFVTGSTIVNGTIVNFLDIEKPVYFYGTTIAAGVEVLGLERYCNADSMSPLQKGQ